MRVSIAPGSVSKLTGIAPTTCCTIEGNPRLRRSSVQRQPRRFRSLSSFVALGALLLTLQINTLRAERSATLAWNPSIGQGVAGYFVYALEENSTTPVRLDAGNANQSTVTHLKEGLRYTFTVTAYNAAGLESLPSNEVVYVVPVPLRLLSPAPATGLWRVQFPASPGLIYELQASVDLQLWTTLWRPEAVATYGSLEFEDPESAHLGCRFYRLLVR